MRRPVERPLLALLLIYGVASLLHFIHNAELIADYPNLPASWSRSDVYLAWGGLTAVGAVGWLLLSRGYRIAGLLFVCVYAALGIDSLGHYVLAPMSAHTAMMNVTILLEVTAAMLVLLEAVRLMVRRLRREPARAALG